MGNRLRHLWLDNRNYFFAACLLFLGGALIGYFQAPLVEEMVGKMMGQLKEIAERIKDNGGGPLAVFWTIFSNNVFSALMMMALGILFALFPIIGMLTNGVLLGFIFFKYSGVGVSPWLIFSAGILPHGIFELPAILFAAGVGIRLGVLSLRSVGVLIQPQKLARLKNDWYDTLKQFPLAVLTVVVLLFVAAIVESTITPTLLKETMGQQLQQLNLLK
ncbi:stage II sporulation protein M [Brevibacillus sp. HB1.3]|uniref:stage II sporulation protein M n=1 Tax=Brevibacillus sp. HB1.3 TaxID=2738842 RepID=UPI0015523BA7|nr:stage II sporulation protein M [Brevibacillus sp. HB1.3]NQF17667.1 stage II sporulation protein M [Brevibacillus sp. HB1.3]